MLVSEISACQQCSKVSSALQEIDTDGEYGMKIYPWEPVDKCSDCVESFKMAVTV